MKFITSATILLVTVLFFFFASCKKKSADPTPTPTPTPTPQTSFTITRQIINSEIFNGTKTLRDINLLPVIQLSFTQKIDRTTLSTALSYYNKTQPSVAVDYSVTYSNNDSVLIVTTNSKLPYLNEFAFSLASSLKSTTGNVLTNSSDLNYITAIDSSRKFPVISDDSLLTVVQKQTFKYFWDNAFAASGLARERHTATTTAAIGGSGFGVMAIIVGASRNFVTRAQAFSRIQTIVGFLKNNVPKFHGAFPHWVNGQTGAVIPFGTKDDGGDIVETSYMMQGLLCARQFFNSANAEEVQLRDDINSLYQAVEWTWYRQNGQNLLYWNWSPNYGWDVNVGVHGWNEALITYVLAASSPTYPIPVSVYNNGWTGNGGFQNGNTYYGIKLPLGGAYGGPLFFAHYSFLGINPNGLSDSYTNYLTQNTAHSKINYQFCVINPNSYYGYSDSCWGLTACDVPEGYTACSPTNDRATIAPTAAISSLPYTPVESMKALKFFYYVLGDRIFKEYGFIDAFSLHKFWYDNAYLAIDQGPEIIMIENYRTQLLWNLFTSCPEVKNGMKNVLGFSAPYL